MLLRRALIIVSFTVLVIAPYEARLTFAQEASQTKLYLPLLVWQLDPAWTWQAVHNFTLSPLPNVNDAFLLAIDASGAPHLLYDTLSSPRYIYHTYGTPTGWTVPLQVADSLGISYTLYPPVRDQQGVIHLLWRNYLGSGVYKPYRLMYAAYSDGAWSAEEEVHRSDSDLQGMVRTDSSGLLNVTSASRLLFSTINHFTRTLSGWSAPVEIDPGHSLSLIWPDYSGGVHLFGGISSTPEVVYSYWLNGQYPVKEQTISGELGTGDTLLDGQNNLNLFRRAQVPVPGGTVTGVYHRCLTNDQRWIAERVLSGELETLSPLLKAEDGNSRVALAWQERLDGIVQVRIINLCSVEHAAAITLPDDYSWELEAAALSHNPDQFCLLARRLYSSTNYLVQCASLDYESILNPNSMSP